jgi:hypothetical protein
MTEERDWFWPSSGEDRRGRFSASRGRGGAAVADGNRRRGLIGVGRYELSGERTTWRNGGRERTLGTRLGALQLRIPKLRQSLPRESGG